MAKLKNVIRGDTHTVNLQINNSSGTGVNLTGYEIMFAVNPSAEPTDDSQAIFKLTTSANPSQFNMTNAATGAVVITILPTNTTGVVMTGTTATYYYDIQMVDPSGNITSLPADQFILTADITRSSS